MMEILLDVTWMPDLSKEDNTEEARVARKEEMKTAKATIHREAGQHKEDTKINLY